MDVGEEILNDPVEYTEAEKNNEDDQGEATVEDWWVKESDPVAEQRPNYVPLSEMWPFRGRIARFVRALHYSGPFMRTSKNSRKNLFEHQQTEQLEQEAQEKPATPTESLASTDISESSDNLSTDLEDELKIARRPSIVIVDTKEDKIKAFAKKFIGPAIAKLDKDTTNLLHDYIGICIRKKLDPVRAIAKAIASSDTTCINLRYSSTSHESLRPLIQVLEVFIAIPFLLTLFTVFKYIF